jgi:ubiquinone/menaquinone biosynthesis C-methylase UbiE
VSEGKPKRLKTYELFLPPGDPDEAYQKKIVDRERDYLLPVANTIPENPGDAYYGTDRHFAGVAALPLISLLGAKQNAPVSVLEVGGGEGMAMRYILDMVAAMPYSVELTMTSLNPLPHHEYLKDRGVDIRTPQIAERMPAEWENTFDIVLTCCVLGWTKVKKTVGEIRRVLNPGGYWLGLESSGSSPIESKVPYSILIPVVAYHAGFKEELNRSEQDRWLRNEDFHYFKYKK